MNTTRPCGVLVIDLGATIRLTYLLTNLLKVKKGYSTSKNRTNFELRTLGLL